MDERGDYDYVDQPEPTPAPPPTNGLGIAGFVCSLVGLCAGGLLSPVGLILSLVALGREPRGFAIAGVILGALGSCGFLPLIALAFIAPAVLVGLGLAGLYPPIAANIDMAQLNHEIAVYEEVTGALPESLDDLNLDASRQDILVDPWGNRYVYEQVAGTPGFRVLSTGPDGQLGTTDDIEVNEGWKIDAN
jgi:hypothetical protein